MRRLPFDKQSVRCYNLCDWAEGIVSEPKLPGCDILAAGMTSKHARLASLAFA